jgi:carboxyl-terminal processing protease
MLKESDLKKHLESELAKIDANTTKSSKSVTSTDNNETKVDDTIITEKQLYQDLQLKSAVNILKALIITNKGKI